MKRSITALLLFISFIANAQNDSERKPIDEFMKRFYQKLDTVYWLCKYDDIAWWTSDSVYASGKEEQKKLGKEWFCFEEGKLWHALYGKYRDNQFDAVFHYTVDSNGIVQRSYNPVDSVLTNSFSRALINAKRLLIQSDTSNIRFNQYIKRNDDNSISVWLLPAFTTNSIAVYGGEFYYQFDPGGNSLIRKFEYSQEYKGFKPDAKKEIWLEYVDVDEPTLGSIFFVWYYRRYFDRIVIDAKKFKSTIFHDDSKGYYWVHGTK